MGFQRLLGLWFMKIASSMQQEEIEKMRKDEEERQDREEQEKMA